MSDLIERLCEVQGNVTKSYRNPEGPEAAAEIKRLRTALERIHQTLEPEMLTRLEVEVFRIAREALKDD